MPKTCVLLRSYRPLQGREPHQHTQLLSKPLKIYIYTCLFLTLLPNWNTQRKLRLFPKDAEVCFSPLSTHKVYAYINSRKLTIWKTRLRSESSLPLTNRILFFFFFFIDHRSAKLISAWVHFNRDARRKLRPRRTRKCETRWEGSLNIAITFISCGGGCTSSF